jgi:hypothetical protein
LVLTKIYKSRIQSAEIKFLINVEGSIHLVKMKTVDVTEILHTFATGDKNKFAQKLMEHVDRMPEDLTRIFCYRSK